MDWAVLLHVLVAFAFVAGLVGRNVTIAHARRSRDLASINELLAVANRFDTIVKLASIAVLMFGLIAMVVGDLSVSANGWLVASIALYIALGLLVPIVFIPRGGSPVCEDVGCPPDHGSSPCIRKRLRLCEASTPESSRL